MLTDEFKATKLRPNRYSAYLFLGGKKKVVFLRIKKMERND